MAPKKDVYCGKCGGHHARPVGKKCTIENSTVGSSNLSIQHPDTVEPLPTHQPAGIDAVLSKLEQIEARQELFASQLARLESHRSPHPHASTPDKQTFENFNDEGIVPSLDFLRNANAVQEEVARRLRLLDTDLHTAAGKNLNSTKSGRFRTFNNNITKYVQWPQENVFIGASRKPVNYDDLNPQQLVLGHLITAMSPANASDRDHMINYLIKLLRESIDGDYESSKGGHACVLHELEKGSVVWSDTQKIDEIRLLYSRKVTSKDSIKRPLENNQTVKKVVCNYFNKGKCVKSSDHIVNNVLYRHVCSHCYRLTSKFYNHSEMSCNRKDRQDGE